MASQKLSYKHLAFIGLVWILTGCSVEKNTGTTRFYHGLTARYNIYFNGYESFKSGIQKIHTGYRDDYAELIRVFEYSDPSTAMLCSSDMEKAIQKASKLISLKSISARPEVNSDRELNENEKKLLEQKEFNEWVDDSYFLIGKARFYKHEFDEAEAVFNYCIENANDPGIKTESVIWLARVGCEKGNYNESLRLLNDIQEIDTYEKSFKALYFTTLSDLFIKQKRYSEAIDPLTVALENISGRRTKYRLTYLLAQLYENTGDAVRATILFRDVVNMNPPYDVEFNARINIAGVFDVNSGNPSEMIKELEKMLRDSKNKDYQDQIYYALGNMLLKEGKENEALDLYRKSVAASSVNQNQKGRSYLALATHYFDKPDYLPARKYYDSAVYFIDQSHSDYLALKARATDLNLLAGQLVIIQTEDSLQRVAKMNTTQRDALIAGIIAKITADERAGRTSEYSDRYNMGEYYESERRFEDNIAQEGKWYFYNQAALTFGRTEFRRRWGDRKLEDNWRRANRSKLNIQGGAVSGEEENLQNGNVTAVSAADNTKPGYYLKNLPLNDSLLLVSNEKLAYAYLNSGKVFAEKFINRERASESFEALLTRFPDHSLAPETLYNLQQLFREVNPQRAEIYRQRLISKYPENEFSRILSDPDYYKKKLDEIRLVENLYEEAYNAYSREDFLLADSLCNSALAGHGQDALAPKFMLLKAYSIARTSDERELKDALNNLVKLWPESGESKKALEIIAYINQEIPQLRIEEDKEIASVLYIADTTSQLTFRLVIPDRTFNINQASFDVISHNIDNYTDKNYRTEGTLVDDKYIIITVSGFTDNREAWNYYKAFTTEKILRNSAGIKLMTFLINDANRKVLETDKNPERYLLFFRDNYLNGSD